MLPNPITIFGQNIYWYGILIAIGIVVCFGILFYYGKKRGMESKLLDFIFYAGVVSIALGFLSAAIFQGVYNAIAGKGFSLTGGITFIGGLIGGIVVFLLAYLLIGKKYGKLSDIAAIAPCCILVAHGFGRLGCFAAGCCYGAPTTGAFSFLGVSFLPGSGAYAAFGSTPLHPTQLYEAVFLFIMFGVCSYLYLKKGGENNLSIYLIAYGAFRFLIEYVRNDYRGSFLGIISPSQFWSILMILAGIILIVMKYVYPKYWKKRVDKFLSDRKAKKASKGE